MRASYRRALDWIVQNDDTDWLFEPNGSISVTAALVADLWGKTDEEITSALRRLARKRKKNDPR